MRFKRAAVRMLALCLGIVSLLVLAGCSQSTSTAGKMHYDLTAEPINLDPQTASDVASMTVINQIFEPLFTLDEQGELEAAAAESYTLSADERTYQIVLRSGMKWQNGAILDAEDYAFAIQRILLADTQSPYAESFFVIQNAQRYHNGEVDFSAVGVSSNGLYLTITLEEKNEHFLNLLASTAAMPCQKSFFESTKGKYGLEANATLANGPFYLQTWSHEQYLKLTKNENYRESDTVMISGVTMWTNNIDNREESFWKGRTHAALVSGESYAQKLKEDPSGIQKYQADAISNTVYGVVFNKDCEALQNTYIRKALAALFNRDVYSDSLPVYLTATDRAIASDCAVYAKPYTSEYTLTAGVKKAVKWYKKGLEQLGTGSITGLKIAVLDDADVPNDAYFLKISQEYQKYLNLYIGVSRLSKEEFDAAIAAGEYDLAIVPVSAEDLSPSSIFEDFASGSFACSNPEFLKLYRSIQRGTGDLLAESRQAEEILLSNGWFIPMYEKSQYFICGQNTTGIEYNAYTGLVSFRNAEILSE